MSRRNEWFVPGDGIAREVITADIQRYLGPDALVRPGVGNGEYQGQQGYWITAYRTLTSPMIQDLRLDSQRWHAERQPEAGRSGGGSHSPHLRDTKVSRGPDSSLVAYQDSRTHAARQHWGPSAPYETQQQQPQPQPQRTAYDTRVETKQPSRSSYSSAGYGQPTSEHYTTSPSPYQTGYTPSAAAPRTQPATEYHQNPPSRDPGYQAQQYYASQQQQQQPQQQPDGYNRPPQSSASGYASASQAAPGYYIASDGNQYPLSQQPQTNPQPQSNRQGSTRYPGQSGRG